MSDFIIQSDRLATLSKAATELLTGIGRGIEKESLRVTPDGHIATTPHPAGLGSSLTHRYITTDFSEALLEFHTPVFHDVDAMMDCLDEVHCFTAQNLGDESMWAASMPCVLGGDPSIPLAQYGTSNLARMKTVYRRGLGHRYGRAMQAIAGMHYNFSLPDAFWPVWQERCGHGDSLQSFRNATYMGGIRNCLRHHALIVYLFGASPAVCKSFGADLPIAVAAFNDNTLYGPEATSLRLSEIGYQNDAQSGLDVSYNDLVDYAAALDEAVATPYEPYEKIGLRDGEVYKQLNANILQVENEFYGWARPKRAVNRGERVTHALRERGVQYMEIRSLDLNPFEPLGIHRDDVRFLDVYLLSCVLAESPPFTPAEEACLARNHERVVLYGRNPTTTMSSCPGETPIGEWMERRLDAMAPVAQVLDAAHGGDAYARSLERQRVLVQDPDETPSARSIASMREREIGFFPFAIEESRRHTAALAARALSPDRVAHFEEAAIASREAQARIEAEDTLSFDAYLARYYAT